VVEDLEYHLSLIRAGYRVRFAEGTRVLGEMPISGPGVRTQRARWEGGRLRMLVEAAPLLVREVCRGQGRLLEPLLDLLLLPLAFHVLLLCLILALPVPWMRLYGLAGLLVVAAHVLVAIAVGGRPRDLAVLALAPFYVLWKIFQLPLLLRTARRNARWIRTRRSDAS